MAYDNMDNINNVLKHLYDSVNGLNECADQSKSQSFKQTLNEIATERQQFIDEIKSTVAIPHTEFVSQGSLAGPLHRLYIDLKSLITKGDTEAINQEIKRGDDTLISAYREAIRDEANHSIQALLTRQLSTIEKELQLIDKF